MIIIIVFVGIVILLGVFTFNKQSMDIEMSYASMELRIKDIEGLYNVIINENHAKEINSMLSKVKYRPYKNEVWENHFFYMITGIEGSIEYKVLINYNISDGNYLVVNNNTIYSFKNKKLNDYLREMYRLQKFGSVK